MTATLRTDPHGKHLQRSTHRGDASLSVRLSDGHELTVPVVRSKRRTLALHVTAHGVEIRAPFRCSVAVMSKFLDSKRAWLGRALLQMASVPPRKQGLADGDIVLALGEKLILRVRHGEKEGVVRRAFELYVTVSKSVAQDSLQHKVMELTEGWYRQLAAKHLLPRVKELASKVGMRPQSVRIGRARSSWGRCVQGGQLHFTWHLLKAPPHVIDSVVTHELCHLEQMNHSSKFWELVDRHDPDHLLSRAWLRDNASLLLE